jgi:hypothetical protein
MGENHKTKKDHIPCSIAPERPTGFGSQGEAPACLLFFCAYSYPEISVRELPQYSKSLKPCPLPDFDYYRAHATK